MPAVPAGTGTGAGAFGRTNGKAALPAGHPCAVGADPDFVYEKIGGRSHCQHLHRVSVLPAAPLGTHRRGGADAEHAGRRAGLYPADAGDVLSPAPLFRGRGL